MAATRKTNYYEVSLVHPHCSNTVPPVYASDYSDDLETVSADGTVPVPNDPGLGVEYDWDFIRDHQTGNVHIYQ
jgi:L-alanine-DL-glutamate epimerase-like enolase superfamily enzyme